MELYISVTLGLLTIDTLICCNNLFYQASRQPDLPMTFPTLTSEQEILYWISEFWRKRF